MSTQIGSEDDWGAVSGGYECGFAVKTDGTLWAWGWNSGEYGGLGFGDTNLGEVYSVPTQVGSGP